MKMHLFTTRGITRSWMDYGNQNRGWTKLGPIDSEHVCIRRESNSVGRADFYTFSLLFLLGGTTTFLLVWKNFVLSIWTKKYIWFFLLKKRERLRLYALFFLVYSELCIQIDIIPLHLRCKAQEILHTTWIKLSNRQNSTVSNGRLFLTYPKQSSIILEESHKCAVLSRSHNPKNEKWGKRN